SDTIDGVPPRIYGTRGTRWNRIAVLIYHIVLPEVWAAFDTELYRAASLDIEGFIHCSFANQLDRVIERYYKNAGTVVVLEIETERLMSRVLNEPSTGN